MSRILNVDYVMVGGIDATPETLEGMFEARRTDILYREELVFPVFDEAEWAVKAKAKLSASEIEGLKVPYNLDDPLRDGRFTNPFDYTAAKIQQQSLHLGKLYRLKGEAGQERSALAREKNRLFSRCLSREGAKGMGGNAAEREAWFYEKYPALSLCCTMYDDFMEEIDNELSKWLTDKECVSRLLSAYQFSWSAKQRI